MFHAYLNGARFLGGARTEAPYALYKDEHPVVLRDQPVSPIIGEVYDVSDGMLAMIDALEEHPRLYCREQAPVRLDNGHRLSAWIYFFVKKPNPTARIVPGGDLNSDLFSD